MGRPRSCDWLFDEIADWKAAGLTDIVSLLEDREIRELDLAREAELAEWAGLSFEQFPTSDRGVPPHPKTRTLWERLATKIRRGGSVGIHCRASIGRGGLVAVGVLLRLGIPESAAWQRTSKARGRSVPDTDEQRLWVVNAVLREPLNRSHGQRRRSWDGWRRVTHGPTPWLIGNLLILKGLP